MQSLFAGRNLVTDEAKLGKLYHFQLLIFANWLMHFLYKLHFVANFVSHIRCIFLPLKCDMFTSVYPFFTSANNVTITKPRNRSNSNTAKNHKKVKTKDYQYLVPCYVFLFRFSFEQFR